METFWNLKVARKAHKLVLNVYKITRNFPKIELYGLVPQMRRASISIIANIAEASKRHYKKDRIRFFIISNGSLEELKYYLILSADLEYISKIEQRDILEKCREVGAMLNGLINSLK